MGSTLCARSRSVRALALLACTAAFSAPASASQVDSWGGQIFLEDVTDVFAYPHRSLDFSSTAQLVYVPTTPDGPVNPSAGLLTVGKGSWQAFLGGNAPNAFNPLAAYGSGSERGWGEALYGNNQHLSHLVLGLDAPAMPMPKLQFGAALKASDALSAGVALQTFGQKVTTESTTGTDPAETTGGEISGYSLTGSGALGVDLFNGGEEIEAAISYGSSDRDQFSPVDGNSGTGDASSFSMALGVNLGDLGLIDSAHGMDWRLYGRIDNTSSDHKDDDLDDGTVGDKLEDSESVLDLRIGATHQNEAVFAFSTGVKRTSFESIVTDPADKVTTEVKTTLFPCCDAAGQYPIGKGFSIDYGVMVAWRSRETTTTTDDAVTGDQLSQTVNDNTGVETSYHVGIQWAPRSDVSLSVTVDPTHLDDPGGMVFGNDAVDGPVVAFGAQYRFGS